MDARVLLFTLSVSVIAGVLFGAVPALQLAGVDVNATLREEGRGTSAGRARVKARDALVVGQIALSLLLLIGAGLLVRSFVRLLAVDPGFEAHNVLTVDVSLSTLKYGKPDQQIAFFDEVLEAGCSGTRGAQRGHLRRTSAGVGQGDAGVAAGPAGGAFGAAAVRRH